MESSFNVLEIRAFNTLSQNQVRTTTGPYYWASRRTDLMSKTLMLPFLQILVETERGLVSMRLPSAESVDQVTRHVSSALSKVCPGPG